jgi:phage shock protein PspC (stress-responsive transcriptional regulator)
MNGSHRRLERSRTDRWLAGVCSGIARYLDVDTFLVRLLFLISLLVTGGATLLIYLVLWAVIPLEATEATDPVRENLDEIRAETERWIERIRGWLQSIGLLRDR